MAEHDQQFETFQTWVNKASSWLRRRGEFVRAVCFDAKGRHCGIGRDFMRARDDDAFPVRFLWPDQIGSLAIRHKSELPELIAGVTVPCTQCEGTGRQDDGGPCPECDGTGTVSIPRT